MSNYDYTFQVLDGEYHLRQCFNMQVHQLKDESKNPKKWKLVDTSILFGNFLASMMKLKREYNARYVIIAFDKSPYYHKSAIENYKGDRYIASDRLKEIEEELNDEDLSEEERDELEREKLEVEYDDKNFWKYQEVKKSLIETDKEDWANAGIHTIYKRGYEADQLAYYLATLISEQHLKNNKVTCMLGSSDKDWTNFVLPGVEFISTWSGNLADRKYGKLTEEWEDFHKQYLHYAKHQKIKEDWKDITRYEYGILTELFVNSHNNATLFEEQEDDFKDILIEKYIEELIEKGGKNRRVLKPIAKQMATVELFFRIINKCKNKKFNSYKVMRNAFKAMNINLGKTVDNGKDSKGNPLCENIGVQYRDDLNPLCMSVLKNCGKYKRGTIMNLCEEHEISINMMNYSKFVSSLKGTK